MNVNFYQIMLFFKLVKFSYSFSLFKKSDCFRRDPEAANDVRVCPEDERQGPDCY